MKLFDFYKKFKATRFGQAFVRTQYRSTMLLCLSFSLAAIMEFFVQSARFGTWDLAAKYPEMLQILRAISILTWFDQAILWLRLIVSPKIDIQALANKLTGTGPDDSMASSAGIMVVYITNNVAWLVRLIALYLLAGL